MGGVVLAGYQYGRVDALFRVIHGKFLWLLVGVNVAAAFFPALGLELRGLSLGSVTVFHETTTLRLPMLMLGLLLFNGGLGVPLSQLRGLVRRPLPLLAGLVANLFVPLAFIFALSHLLRFWPHGEEVQSILVGLALVAAMPIAGSSAAWAQNANGNLALSLGLVLASTFLSPLTTPAALHSVGWMATGDYSDDLHALASYGTGAFLLFCVVLPSVAGILTRAIVGDARATLWKPSLKLFSALNLLLLCYSNAAVSLPEVVANPNPKFLFVTAAVVISLCLLAFFTGWAISQCFHLDREKRTSLMFGLGMNNNGTGLVLASMTLADYPLAMLPIIFYNLVQHLVAGGVDSFLCHPKPRRA